jgi:signal transduction histidine kinase
VTTEALDQLAGAVDGPSLNAAVRWAAAGCSVRRLASEIQDARDTDRGLVLAVKGFTHMDQATIAEPVDLAQSLGNTVAVLKSKARGKSVAVSVQMDPGLPRVPRLRRRAESDLGESLDNALDAVPESGRVEVVAGRESRGVVVRIADNGPGIPPRSETGSSIRSSRRSRPDMARVWASTSSAGSSVTTTAKSPSSRGRAGRSFR